MKFAFLVLLALIGILLLWCLLLLPRRKHPGWPDFEGVRFAHRGLHDAQAGIPENSLAAFRAAVERGFGAELDVHLMADGNLAVVHDSNLQRVCGKDAVIEQLTAAGLPDYPLQGTGECIPLLSDVLALFEGRTPLIIELKVVQNAAALVDAVLALLQNWDGKYCIESFHTPALTYLKARYPQVLRGQLSQNYLRREKRGSSPWLTRARQTLLLTTLSTRPDFIAYRYQDRACVSLRLMRRLYGVHEVGWTIRDPRTLERLEREGVLPIFEGFVPAGSPRQNSFSRQNQSVS